jgi:hypothetical protein
VFPSKEAGDYFNNNVILIKYSLDLEDPDGIMEKYAIRAYPTFIFVDGDGNEYTRFLGGAADTKAFLERAQNALKPENSWAYRNEKLASDPSYAVEHIRHLNSLYMQDPAKELLNKVFEARTIQENFSEESISLYHSLITDTNAPIVEFMVNHQEEVVMVMGEERYLSFLTSKANTQLSSKLGRMDIEKPESVTDVENDIKKMVSNPLFKSKYSDFLANNFNHIKSKNHNAIFENSKKLLPVILSLNTNAARMLKTEVDPEVIKQRSIVLHEIAIEYVQDARYLELFQRTLDRLKNTP